MPRVLAVSWREFKHTALTKAFIFSAIIFPLGIWVLFPVLAALVQREVPPLTGVLALVDPTGEVAEAAGVEFDADRIEAERARRRQEALRLAAEASRDPEGAMNDALRDPSRAAALATDEPVVDVSISVFGADADLGELKQRVRRGEFVAVASIDPDLLALGEDGGEDQAGSSPRVALYVPSDIKGDHTRILKRRLGDAVVRARALRSGQDPRTLRDLMRRPGFESVALTDDGSEARESVALKEMLPFAFLMLLWVASFTSGQYLLTTTIEEKSNKVMEVLLSAVSPLQLMTGKILGQGLVAVVMLAMYGGLLVSGLVLFATLDLIPPSLVVCFLLYFVMAYFFVAATMAAIGSAVSDLHEAQSLMAPAMIVLIVAPMISGFVGSQNPNGLVATVLSFIPPITPFAMIARLPSGEVPAWQVLLSFVVGFAGVVASLWACAKVFRVGVLMQGKPPSPLEMLRWLRYS